MYYYELQQRIRHEELRREADFYRVVREAMEGQADGGRAVGSGRNEAEGRVRRGRSWWGRVRRAAV
ncbi:hypothetical protein [Streptomyces sp. NPDC003077]|uniref:hypothetical protein n=1 Tax=Streptomyces sp. NPDC003077 TaxID=3154443 RepID=UPI0033AD1283